MKILYGANAIGKTRILHFVNDILKVLKFENNIDINGHIIIKDKENKYKIVVSSKIAEVSFDNKYETSIELSISNDNSKEVKSKYNGNIVTFIKNFDQLYKNYTFEKEKEINTNKYISFVNHLEKNIKVIFTSDTDMITTSKSTLLTTNPDYKVYNQKKDEATEKLIKIVDPSIKEYIVEYHELKFEDGNYEVSIEKSVILNDGIKLAINSQFVSSGIKRMINISEYLYDINRSEGSIYLIDELDPYVHDFLFQDLIKIMKNNEDYCQILLVSHNSTIINLFERKNTLMMHLNDNKIVVKSPDSENTSASTNFEKMYRERKIFDVDYNKYSIGDIFEIE